MSASELPTSPTVGQVVAHRVRKYREARGWTQQQLADEMDALGYPINRATLAKLEAGTTRADNVPLREVLILAAALDVPPVLLFTPLGEREDVQVTPAHALHPHFVLNWMRGEQPFARRDEEGRNIAKAGGGWQQNALPVEMFNELGRLTEAVRRAKNSAQAAENMGDPQRIEVTRVRHEGTLRQLDQQLRYMRTMFEVVPAMPDEWTARMAELRAEEVI